MGHPGYRLSATTFCWYCFQCVCAGAWQVYHPSARRHAQSRGAWRRSRFVRRQQELKQEACPTLAKGGQEPRTRTLNGCCLRGRCTTPDVYTTLS
eukprot:9488132-Pyramimonas_sp.AAC.1